MRRILLGLAIILFVALLQPAHSQDVAITVQAPESEIPIVMEPPTYIFIDEEEEFPLRDIYQIDQEARQQQDFVHDIFINNAFQTRRTNIIESFEGCVAVPPGISKWFIGCRFRFN